jgi:hypothetical protein
MATPDHNDALGRAVCLVINAIIVIRKKIMIVMIMIILIVIVFMILILTLIVILYS